MDAMSGGTPTSDGQEILDYFALAEELDLLLADDALHVSDPAARRRYYETTTRYTDSVLSQFGQQSWDGFTVRTGSRWRLRPRHGSWRRHRSSGLSRASSSATR
jgi:hypothetical protein